MFKQKINKKEGATALFMVLAVPIFMMVFSFMLDQMVTENLRNRLQRQLDISTLAVGYSAQQYNCEISPTDLKKGMDLFVENVGGTLVSQGVTENNLPVYYISKDNDFYALEDHTSAEEKANGITKLIVIAEHDAFFVNYVTPLNYKIKISTESISICNTSQESGGVIQP